MSAVHANKAMNRLCKSSKSQLLLSTKEELAAISTVMNSMA